MELSRNFVVESVARLNPTPSRGLDESRPVADAVGVMRRERVGCVVVSRGGLLIGVFTERDLLTRVFAPGRPLSTPLSECLTPGAVTVTLADPVRVALRRMRAGGYRHLPVVDEAGRPVGILSAKRVVRYVVEHVPALVYARPPAGAVARGRFGA